MSSYYRPYFDSPRERSDRERDSSYDRRRSGRHFGDEDFERERFRDFRSRDAYGSREWPEPFDPEDSERGESGEFGRGRFEQFEDWERPRELSSRSSYRRSGGSYGYGAGTSSFGRAYRGASFGAQESPFGRGQYGEDRFEPYGRSHRYGPYAGRGPKGYQRSDERVKEEVCDRLTADPQIDATEIEVSVQNGEVSLEGTVCERRMKRDAEDCAESVPGVREVHNRIRIDARGGASERRGVSEGETEEQEGLSGVSRFWRSAH